MLKSVGLMTYKQLKTLCDEFIKLGATVNETDSSLNVTMNSQKIVSAIWRTKSQVHVQAREGLINKVVS